MTTFLILAVCVVALWAGSKVLNRLHKVSSQDNMSGRPSPATFPSILINVWIRALSTCRQQESAVAALRVR
jgi:hypothetical protein